MPTPQLTVIAAGDFGARVAARLADRYPGSEVIDANNGTHMAAWPTLDVLVATISHDNAPLVELVERAAFAWRRPWLPVLLEQAHLRCGPVVVPGRTACHVCFRRRRRQHALNPELWTEIPLPALGSKNQVTGWADHHIGIAVGLVAQAVSDAVEPTPEAPGGWVRTVDLMDSSIRRVGVVAVDGCARCRDTDARTQRTTDLLTTLRMAAGHASERNQ
jgi:bacteriocin biosynthesis cyclodehydratase domain-containing protein